MTHRAHPARIGKYRIDCVLGEGAMGVVYQGHDPNIDRVVAIKTLHPHLVSAEERAGWLARFAREAKAAGRVLHPNLVTVFDYLEIDQTPYLVMEYVAAETLGTRMRRPPVLSVVEVGAILDQILDGLDGIHEAGIVHRDMKPDNVLLLQSGRVKIADFGVARVESLGATQGGMIGTPHYMSPEQFAGEEADCRADLFATGVILYELLSGRRPHEAKGLAALAAQAAAGRYIRLTDLVPRLPSAFDALIAEALAPDPDRRFPSARAFRVAARDVFAGRDLSHLDDWDRTLVAGAEPDGTGIPFEAMTTRLPPPLVARLESLMAERIGPIARVIVRTAAGTTSDMDRMIDALAGHLEEDERDGFRAAVRAQVGEQKARPGISEETLAEMIRLLLPHVGPMAKVLVRRAAATVRTPAELGASLAGHISNDRDRKAFLAAVS